MEELNQHPASLEELNQHSLEELKWRVENSPLRKSLEPYLSKLEWEKLNDCEPQESPRG